MNLTELFARFIGREMPIAEREFVYTNKRLGDVKGISLYLANPNDSTLAAIKEVASQNGLVARLSLPGDISGAQYKANQVKACVRKSDDGLWRVTDFKPA